MKGPRSLRRLINKAMVQLLGMKGPGTEPAYDDLFGTVAGALETANYRRLTKQQCVAVLSADRGLRPGSFPALDTSHLLEDFEATFGALPDDSVLWSALGWLHECDPGLDEKAIDEAIAEHNADLARLGAAQTAAGRHVAAAPTPGQIFMGKPPKDEAVLAEEKAVAGQMAQQGILRKGVRGRDAIPRLPDGSLDPNYFDLTDVAECKVVSPAHLHDRDGSELRPTAEAVAAGTDVQQLNAVAASEAAKVLAALVSALEGDSAPVAALNEATAHLHEPGEKRLVADMRWLNEFAGAHAITYADIDDFLEYYHDTRCYGKDDASEYYYHIALKAGVRKYFCIQFGR